MNLPLIPITVIAAKFDVFAQQTEPKNKKMFCSALRYLCAANGCDLVFTSIKEQIPLRNFKNITGWHTFKSFAMTAQESTGDE